VLSQLGEGVLASGALTVGRHLARRVSEKRAKAQNRDYLIENARTSDDWQSSVRADLLKE
jgi:hypothetical protein